MPVKRKVLFDIFVDKGLKFRFLLLKLSIAPFYNSKISVKHDKTYALIIACVKLRTTCCGVDRPSILNIKTEGSFKITSRNIKRLL